MSTTVTVENTDEMKYTSESPVRICGKPSTVTREASETRIVTDRNTVLPKINL